MHHRSKPVVLPQQPIRQVPSPRGRNLELPEGHPPLSWSAKKGHKAIVKLLLEKGAELESKNKYSRTPLWLATAKRHESVVKLLLEKGAESAV
jgi:ankyrin repeat protein